MIGLLAVFIVGLAGAGKTYLTKSLKEYLKLLEEDVISVNLDPAVSRTPYHPEIDVRDYIDINEIMDRYDLGPNGALIAAYDMLATEFDNVLQEINYQSPSILLLDTPGQMELSTLRKSVPYIRERLSFANQVCFFLIDSFTALNPVDLVTQLWLSVITHFKLNLTLYNVLSKIDLLSKDVRRELIESARNPEKLYEKLVVSGKPMDETTKHLVRDLDNIMGYSELIPCSSLTMEGIDVLCQVIEEFK